MFCLLGNDSDDSNDGGDDGYGGDCGGGGDVDNDEDVGAAALDSIVCPAMRVVRLLRAARAARRAAASRVAPGASLLAAVAAGGGFDNVEALSRARSWARCARAGLVGISVSGVARGSDSACARGRAACPHYVDVDSAASVCKRHFLCVHASSHPPRCRAPPMRQPSGSSTALLMRRGRALASHRDEPRRQPRRQRPPRPLAAGRARRGS